MSYWSSDTSMSSSSASPLICRFGILQDSIKLKIIDRGQSNVTLLPFCGTVNLVFGVCKTSICNIFQQTINLHMQYFQQTINLPTKQQVRTWKLKLKQKFNITKELCSQFGVSSYDKKSFQTQRMKNTFFGLSKIDKRQNKRFIKNLLCAMKSSFYS